MFYVVFSWASRTRVSRTAVNKVDVMNRYRIWRHSLVEVVSD